MWHDFWTVIDTFLTSSAPSDGWIYDAKAWVLSNVTEPILEVAYVCGIRSYKPIAMYQAEDLI
jgi:hypothetical protein